MATPDLGQSDELLRFLMPLWQELLDRDGTGGPEISPDSNFFVLGGHSLLGITLLGRVEERTGCKLRLADLFKAPTPRRLAEVMLATGNAVTVSTEGNPR
ncbi:acyl carrier protein [Kitasatospora sp. NPDC056327]|uniref:acyl carrier protein n=1 Tax=Kitasatospora sp. NPDC056327 TaxID=3345785 RepID=UPI0035DE1CA9